MYLSRLILNPRDRRVRRDLADCHELHRTLLSGFPQRSSESESEKIGARAEFGLLFRLDSNPRTDEVFALVQSQIRPDWRNLPADYLLEREDNPACKSLVESYGTLTAGMKLLFRLRANPTRRIAAKSPTEKSNGYGKRVEIHKEEDQIAWLKRKAEAGGFRVLAVRMNPEALNESWRRSLTFGSVLFDGELSITDTETFCRTLATGIGSGKAYGFGLLSIARRGGNS